MNLLKVMNLVVRFPVHESWFRQTTRFVRAVDGTSFTLDAGQTVGLVGESGCGKTTLGRAIVRLIRPTSGQILFKGKDIAPVPEDQLRQQRREFQMIFQDPYGSLNPRMTVSQIIEEPLEIQGFDPAPAARRSRIESLLNDVGLNPALASRYPHEFSGGQRQRIGIARALAMEPGLLVCDEPVSALDVSVQAQVVNLLQDLQAKRNLGILFVAHDLAVVEHISDQLLVMYLGRFVETGPAQEICASPAHPYTRALISSIPVIHPPSGRKRITLGGELPSPINPPAGCPFHPRCPIAEARCKTEMPALRDLGGGRSAACHLI